MATTIRHRARPGRLWPERCALYGCGLLAADHPTWWGRLRQLLRRR